MHKMTIIFLNTRFSDFYSEDLFAQIKKIYQARIVAVIDEQFKGKIGQSLSLHVDETIVVPANSKDGFLAEFDLHMIQPIIEKERQQTDNLRIVCSDEFNLLTAGKLRRLYGLSGHTDKSLVLFRDKLKMKACLQAAGIRVPRYLKINQVHTFDSITAEVGLPFVLKPVDSSGSHGVHIIRCHGDYVEFQNINRSDIAYQADEFISGKLYHVDSWLRGQQMNFICANEYTCPNYDFTKGSVLGSIPLPASSALGIRLKVFAEQALRALNAHDMINHMELFHTEEDEIVFLEVSARPPGALINLTHRINFGINLIDEDFFLQTGLHCELKRVPHNEKCCWALIPNQPGQIARLTQPKVKSRVDMTWFVCEGMTVLPSQCSNIICKAGQVILYNADQNALYEDFERLKHYQGVEVDVYAQAS